VDIALVTNNDPFDRRAWGGVPFQMRESLSRHAEVRVVLVDRRWPLPDRLLARACRMAGKRYVRDNSLGSSLTMGRAASREIRKQHTDVVVAITTPSVVAGLDVDQPVVHVNDNTFRLLKDYYPFTTDLCLTSSLQAEWIERRALRRAGACVFSTSWAAESAIVDYHLDARKVHFVDFGALLVPGSWPPARATPRRAPGPRLLFIAGSFVDESHDVRVGEWWRKGGPRAVRVLDELASRGHGASLSIVGDVPVQLGPRDDIELCGYLDPNTDVGREALSREYLDADVLLDPTPATCTGLVLLDAAAHGLPVVAADTGGVSSVVARGETGILLPPRATPADYASAVETVTSPAERASFSSRARARYESALNWERWAEKTMEIARQLLATQDARL
jgi:glycosyltransferase involved in cell wall biosynthesis